MKKSKIALKPYLDALAGYCDPLSKKELRDVLICIAKDVPTSGRVEFLKKMESYLPGSGSVRMPDLNPVEQILADIEALKESIEERITSIDDGSYWDDPDVWEEDGYDEEAPDPLSGEQSAELEGFFVNAENLFLDDRLEEARKVYEALFDLVHSITQEMYYSPPFELDMREERARYCRCVYETSKADKRLDEFVKAMEVNVFEPHVNEYDEEYPLLQDVIDARPDEMEDLESFLPAWKGVLTKKGLKARPAVLLLEAVNRLEGADGAAKLARKWKDKQPQGYLFWLGLLKKANDREGVIRVAAEALKALKEGRFREDAAEFMVDAAGQLKDAKHLLLGKREKFFSHRSDQNLLDLVNEATKQNVRDRELDKVLRFFRNRKSSQDEKVLYAKALLMAGRLSDAAAAAKNAKGVGWSYGSSAGVVFGSILSVLADHSDKACATKNLLKGYANQISVFSERISIDDGKGLSFYDEIIKGLGQEKGSKSQADEFFPWAERIGKKRIDHIVSNKHRRAYERAAQVLVSLAEAYIATDQESMAAKIVRHYYSEKYNRFSAFRSEVKTVFMKSELLRNTTISL